VYNVWGSLKCVSTVWGRLMFVYSVVKSSVCILCGEVYSVYSVC